MILTAGQQVALTELINIAFPQTAAAISDNTARRVLISTPQIAVHPMEEMQDILTSITPEEVATVHQIFTGPVAVNAMLVPNYDGAARLELTPYRDTGTG